MTASLRQLLPPGPALSAHELVESFALYYPSTSAQVPSDTAKSPSETAQTPPTTAQIPSAAAAQAPSATAAGATAAGAPSAMATRPRVLLNMVSTLDGRATLGGRSGAIGNRADRELFHALRAAVDAVLVGAGTARAEHYRQLVRDEQARALRRARGLAEEPLACIVSQGLALEDIPLLEAPQARVVILTPSPASLSSRGAQIEYLRTTGNDGQLDLHAALEQLTTRYDVRTILCEGGPHLNGQLLAAGLVDELFLSLAPKLAGDQTTGQALRIVAGRDFDPAVALELVGVSESESHLFLRYRISG
jgi:riboflavin-specific deaminase-like protein